MTAVAFTGTRKGLTPLQRESLRNVLAELPPGMTLHNGVAVGADVECLDLAWSSNLSCFVLWPASDDRFDYAKTWVYSRRALGGVARVNAVVPPLDRNQSMVAACGILIACPEGPEVLRSGTWSTVRAARRWKREVIIVWPDGRVTRPSGSAGLNEFGE